MFVFEESQLETICDYIVFTIQPTKETENIYTPANIIFLAARYAYYFNSIELLKKFFSNILKKLDILLKVIILLIDLMI